MSNTDKEKFQHLLETDPASVAEVLFKTVLWQKQREIITSVWNNPRTAVKSCNSGGKSRIAAIITLLYLMTFKPSRAITTAPCYDDKTEILTKRGWILFKDLKLDDLVAEYDNGKIDFVNIKGFVKFPYQGEMIGYKSPLYDFLVTPEHKCLYINTNGKVKQDLAKNLYGRSWIKFPRIFESPEIKSDLSLDFCEFLGFWFAEGCSQYNPEKRRYRVCVTQKNKIEYTEDLLKRNDFKYHKYLKKSYKDSPWQGGFNYEIYNKELAKYFEQFKKGARNKELTDFILFFDKVRAERFLHGYIQGDGHIDKNGSVKMGTSSKRLADGLQFLCNKIGWISNIGIQKSKNGYGESYYIGAWQRRGKAVETKKCYWYKQNYDGDVYCVNVPSGFVVVRRNDKIAISGNTFLQVEEILWKEIRSLYQSATFPIGGKLNQTSLEMGSIDGRPWDAMGISTNEVNRFQGFKSPFLLVILDEALGVSPEIWEAMEGLQPHRILAIGNPLEATGNFYDCFSSSLYNKIQIDGEEAVKWQEKHGAIPGLITRQWINERKEEWGVNSPLFIARCRGEFPTETTDTLISRAWVERSRKGLDVDNKPLEEENEEDETKVVASDIATKHGSNETVIGYRYGHTIKEINGYLHLPTTDSRNKIAFEYNRRKALAVGIDSDGVGEGVSDGLVEMRVPVIEFHGGYTQQAMDSTKFRNLRSQFYWLVARKFEKGVYNLKYLSDKSYELLKNQLCSIKVKAPDGMGRIQIETKEDMLARGIKSPDFADCFVILEHTFWTSTRMTIQQYSYR